MSELSTEFEQASRDVKSLKRRPDNTTLLKLYALYKQGTQGDVSGKRPGMFDLKGQAKYDAWKKLKGMGQSEAQSQYIGLVQSLMNN